MGNIGEPRRKVDFEPIPETEPVKEPSPVPVPTPSPEREPEEVPA